MPVNAAVILSVVNAAAPSLIALIRRRTQQGQSVAHIVAEIRAMASLDELRQRAGVPRREASLLEPAPDIELASTAAEADGRPSWKKLSSWIPVLGVAAVAVAQVWPDAGVICYPIATLVLGSTANAVNRRVKRYLGGSSESE